MIFDQADAMLRMRAYTIFMGIKANDSSAELKYDDTPVVETHRVVSLQWDKPSGVMKKRGLSKKGTTGGSLVIKCAVYELDTSV